MDTQAVSCPSQTCPASGQVGQGNMGVHSLEERRYKCDFCGKTFAETKETAFYGLRMAKDIVVGAVTLLACGCPVQAIVMALGLEERTVLSWKRQSVKHCQQVHEHLVEQPRDLGQAQVDEIRVKMQGSSSGWSWQFRFRHACRWVGRSANTVTSI